MINSPPIRTASNAAARANQLTGLNAVSANVTVDREVFRDTTVPFVSSRFQETEAWTITYSNVDLSPIKQHRIWEDDSYKDKRIFTVSIEAESGKLLTITSRFLGPVSGLLPEPAAGFAEKQLRGTGEIYIGLPNSDPEISFVGALQSLLDQGIVNPMRAKEIDGQYVDESRFGGPVRPLWIISLRGIPPRTPKGGEGKPVAEWQANHMRCAVDARTGKCLFRTNVPQPK